MTELIFLRHGETAGNRRKNYIGRTDEPLTREGAAKIAELSRLGLYPAADILFASPMLRTLQTAEIIYPKLCPIKVAELRECDFGQFENKNWQDLEGNAAYQAWIDSGGVAAFPGGESREEFLRRVCLGFERIAGLILRAKPKMAAIVAHGGTIMAILSSYTGGEYYDFMTANGGGWQATFDEKMWQDRQLSDVKALFCENRENREIL